MRKSIDLVSVLKMKESDRQNEINAVIKEVAQNPILKNADADQILDAISPFLITRYSISKMELNELEKCQSMIKKISDNLSGIDENAYNTVTFIVALQSSLNEEIQTRQIKQCIELCDGYIESLEKDKKKSPLAGQSLFEESNSQLQKLIDQKIQIVTDAKKHLITPNSTYEQKIAGFQEVLTRPENASILAKHRNSWVMEVAKQVGTLFLINVYRMLVGTKGSNLLNLSNEQQNKHQEEKVDPLFVRRL